MNTYALISLAYAILYSLIMVIVLKFNSKRSANRVFALVLLSIIIMCFLDSLRRMIPQESSVNSTLFLIKITVCGIPFFVATLYHFSIVFPMKKFGKYTVHLLVTAYFIAIVWVCIILFTNLGVKDVRWTHEGYNFVAGRLFVQGIMFVLLGVFLSLYNIAKSYMKTGSALERSQIKHVFQGVLLTTLIGIPTLFLKSVNMDLPLKLPSTTFLLPLLVFILFAIIKYQLFDVKLLIRKGMIHSTTLLSIFMIAVFSILSIGKLLPVVAENVLPFLGLTLFIMIPGYSPLKKRVTNIMEYTVPQLKYKKYRVEEAFLITTAGLVIAHTESKGKTTGVDKDVVGGMLTAIQNFVKEAFYTEDKDALRSLSMDHTKMLIEHTTNAYMALVYTGDGIKELRSNVQKILGEINVSYGNVLEKWDGDYSRVTGIKDTIQKLLPIEGSM